MQNKELRKEMTSTLTLTDKETKEYLIQHPCAECGCVGLHGCVGKRDYLLNGISFKNGYGEELLSEEYLKTWKPDSPEEIEKRRREREAVTVIDKLVMCGCYLLMKYGWILSLISLLAIILLATLR